MSFKVFFECFYLSLDGLAIFYFYITKGAKREWEFVPLYRAICPECSVSHGLHIHLWLT